MTKNIFNAMTKWITENRDREDIARIRWVIMDNRRTLRVTMKDGGVWDAQTNFQLKGI